MALSANTPRNWALGEDSELGVAASATIYEGSAVGLTAGYARALAAGDTFVGFALAKAVDTSAVAGTINVRVRASGLVELTITSVAVTDIGKPVYASDDGTFTLTQGSSSYIGKVRRVSGTNLAIVEFEAAPAGNVANKVYSQLMIPVQLAAITGNGDVLTTFTPTFAGTIEKVEFFVTTAATTAAKLTDLNLEIGTTNVTGGVVSLTSANCTPLGARVAGTAITAANTFSATDTISVESANTTAFIEGQGVLVITLSQPISN